MNILEKIVIHKQKEIIERRLINSVKSLEISALFNRPCLSLSEYIKRKDKSGVISEFKRRSPSKPNINLIAKVKDVTTGYVAAGASGLSVLTDNHFFGGSTEDLMIAREYNEIPILRKDFVISEYQIIEAKSMGADAILLISEILTKEEVATLSAFANSLGLQVLLELHSEKQLEKYTTNCNLIGVNNRNLETFKTSLDFSKELFNKLPTEAVKISESGIHHIEDALELKSIGYDGFLIGEKFMKSDDPGKEALNFMEQLIEYV